MSSDLKDLPIDEKMDHLGALLGDVLQSLGFEAVVMVIRVSGDSFVAARFPACDETCPSPDRCTVKTFEEASADLKGQAEIVKQRLGKMTKVKGGYVQ